MSYEFLLTSLIVCIAPGTGVVYTLACAISGGRNAALAAAIGGTFGTLPPMIAGLLGLSAVLQASPALFSALKVLGALYLVYLAWITLRDRSRLEVGQTEVKGFGAIVWHAVLINILNPKLAMFFFAFLPQFVDPAGARPTLQMAELGLVFTLMTLLVFLVYGLGASLARRQIIERPKVMTGLRYSFAAAFLGLGGRLLLATV
jgi:threonine/homoserine/homoserine lactone efflux protein